MHLLLVEDDLNLGKALVKVLAVDSSITWVRTLEDARQHMRSSAFDLILLDLGLPDGDGCDWLRSLRQRGMQIPVLILSARDEITDRVDALDLGADDYLVKPFEVEELNARIRALARRRSGSAEPNISVGDLTYLPADRCFKLGDRVISLSPMEQKLLATFIYAGSKPVSREKLIRALGADVSANALEVHIHGLRKQLGRDRITTIRGFGYRLSQT